VPERVLGGETVEGEVGLGVFVVRDDTATNTIVAHTDGKKHGEDHEHRQ